MSLILLMLACSGTKTDGDDAKGANASTDATDFTAAEALLELQSPASSSFLAEGTSQVTGLAHAMDLVFVNGEPATVSGGTFSTEMDFEVGLSGVDVTGTDIDGIAHRDFGAVLAGEFADPSGPVFDAVQLQLSPVALNELGEVAGVWIDPSMLNPSLMALNPLIDTPQAYVALGDLRFDQPTIEFTPGPNGLEMAMTLPNFVLPLDANLPDALPFGIDLSLDPDLEADAVVLYATVDLHTDGNGHLKVDLKNVSAELVGFDLDTGILELVDWLFIDDDDIADLLEDQIANLGPALGDTIEDMVAGLDLKMELDLLGTPLTVWPAFDKASVGTDGVYLSLAIAIDVVGPSPNVPGHLHFEAPPPRAAQNVLMQISDDFINRALFELWAGGALNIELPLAAPEDIATLAIFGGNSTGNLSLTPNLPPVWVEKDGRSRLQLGDTLLAVDTPGGTYGERVEFILNLDAAADISIDAAAAGIVLSAPEVILVPVGVSADNAELIEKAPALGAAFGLGLGAINELLTFPLEGLLGPNIVLPPISLDRDPSHVALATDISLADFDLITLLLGPQPVETIEVPATAIVIDDDMELYLDSEMGWICERNDVETAGNNGTWFVEDGAELIVMGTGHVVWAMDGADIVLDAPGNEVFAHPNANIDDNDGTNVITILDPLTLDLTVAPIPGC